MIIDDFFLCAQRSMPNSQQLSIPTINNKNEKNTRKKKFKENKTKMSLMK